MGRSGKKQKKGGFSCCKKKSVALSTFKTTKKTRTTKTPKTVQKPAMPKSASKSARKSGPKSADSKSSARGKKSGPQEQIQSFKSGQNPLSLEKQKLQPAKNEQENSGNKNNQKRPHSQTLRNLLEDPMLKTAIPMHESSSDRPTDDSNNKELKKISKELKKVALEPVHLHKRPVENSQHADINQAEQTLFVKRYVRNGRVFVNWEYSESYPANQKGPSFSQLLNSKPKCVDLSIAESTSDSIRTKGCNCQSKKTTEATSGVSAVQRTSEVNQQSQEFSSATSIEIYQAKAMIANRK